MALDLDLRHFQTMWPWLAELSILTAVLSIFVPVERGRRAPVLPRIQPWFYINIVLEHFQALLPITRDLLDVDAAVAQVLCLHMSHVSVPALQNNCLPVSCYLFD